MTPYGSVYGGYPSGVPAGIPFMGTAPPSIYDQPMAPMHTGNMLGVDPFATNQMMSPYNPFTAGSPMPSVAPSINPFANPPQNQPSPLAHQALVQQPVPEEPPTSFTAEPSDDELFKVVDWYVRSNWQDDNLTRRKVRDAVFAKFPEADLAPRTQYINELIDRAT